MTQATTLHVCWVCKKGEFQPEDRAALRCTRAYPDARPQYDSRRREMVGPIPLRRALRIMHFDRQQRHALHRAQPARVIDLASVEDLIGIHAVLTRQT